MTLSGPLSTYQRIEFDADTRKAALARSGGRCEGVINSAGERCPMIFNAANPPEFDHVTEAWEGGDASLANCQVLGKKCCHVAKTGASHTRRTKADRQSEEGHWLKRGTKKRPFAGARASRFKRKLNGEIIMRSIEP